MGQEYHVFDNRPGVPRPSEPVPVPKGPTRVDHNRVETIRKRAASTSQRGQGFGSKKRKRSEEAADLEVHGR